MEPPWQRLSAGPRLLSLPTLTTRTHLPLQAPDFAHFHELHSRPLIPWTTAPLPAWVDALLGLRIHHSLRLFFGEDPAWEEEAAEHVSPRSGLPLVTADKRYLVFTDDVVVASRGTPMPKTRSKTIELYAGPAIMVFHIPFTIGALKFVVCTTPVEGHCSIMRVQVRVGSGQ
jgi:hypothetical protein